MCFSAAGEVATVNRGNGIDLTLSGADIREGLCLSLLAPPAHGGFIAGMTLVPVCTQYTVDTVQCVCVCVCAWVRFVSNMRRSSAVTGGYIKVFC